MMMKVLAIAMLCHAANAAYCASIGDTSQVPWDKAPDWQKESAVKGVEFCIAHPDAPASANHESWMAEKIDAGWVYGEKKNPDAKPPTHPCIVPFDQLPVEQQFKDILFKAVVGGCSTVMGGVEPSGVDPAFIAALDPAQSAGVHADVDAMQAKIEALTGEVETANARADKAERSAKSAKASVKQGDGAAAPRKLKKLEDGLTGDELTEALSKADADDKTVEIVPTSNGREIAGVPSTVITGEVWREHSRGKMLRDPITVKGPAEGAGFSIDGYALLIDGKQVAYQARPEPVRVAAGQSVSLQDDIWF
jgi:outer membrane murein-binding lipoprotein Lpp